MFEINNKSIELLQKAAGYYAAMDKFRRDRERNKRYNYGDQWSDVINVDGRRITEEQYIREQGSVPLKNNLIRRLVRTVTGVFNSRADQPTCIARDPAEHAMAETMTALLRYNMQLNRMSALYTRSIEEFLISGLIVHRKSFGCRNGRLDCWTDYVQPNNFFIDNRMRDFRGWDCTMIGEIHDIAFDTLCSRFAKNDDDCHCLREIYGNTSTSAAIADTFGVTPTGAGDFFFTADPSLCRVIEIWELQVRRLPASQPFAMREVWHYTFISPMGHVLAEGDTPYVHGSHPYVVKAYPLIDGEIHSFVADVIDQQRYTNRLITLYDWIMRASSKGVLLVPDECVPRGVSPDDFADTWSRYNGVIFYRPSANGDIPRQVAGNSTNIGIRELLDLQLSFFENISGVNETLMGKTSHAAMSAELFGRQTQNATTTLSDILDTFAEFMRDAAYKDVANIRQCYTQQQIQAITGEKNGADVLDAEYDLKINAGTETAYTRQTNNAMLMEIWKSGQISLEQMLRCGSFPFAEALLASTEKSESESC